MVVNFLNVNDLMQCFVFDVQGFDVLCVQVKQLLQVGVKVVVGQFDVMFMQMMFKSMCDVLLDGGLFDLYMLKMYMLMFDQQFVQQMLMCGIGVVDVLMKQLLCNVGVGVGSDMVVDIGVGGIGGFGMVGNEGSFVVMNVMVKVYVNVVNNGVFVGVCGYLVGSVLMLLLKGVSGVQDVDVFVDWFVGFVQVVSVMIGILVWFIVGQVVFELGWGKCEICVVDGLISYNVFGIKVNKGWIGCIVLVLIIEYVNGMLCCVVVKFCVYDLYEYVMIDYVNLLKNNLCYVGVLSVSCSVEGFVYGMQKVGYVIDLNYVKKLILIMQQIG